MFYQTYYEEGGISDPTWFSVQLPKRWLERLNMATAGLRHAAIMLLENHELRWRVLTNLAVSLDARFKQLGDTEDLDEMVELYRGALKLNPEDPGTWTTNLAVAFHRRFDCHRSLSDLEEAVDLHREALHLQQPSHPEYTDSLYNLANVLRSRFEETGQDNDLTEAVALRLRMLGLPSSDPRRLDALSPIGTDSSISKERLQQWSARLRFINRHLVSHSRTCSMCGFHLIMSIGPGGTVL